jgi:hypothetical protein
LLRYWTRSAKPDAYTVLAAAGYRDEWWIEVDQAVEVLPRLRRKLKTSVDHANTGGIGPLVSPWRVDHRTDPGHRCRAIGDLITLPPPPPYSSSRPAPTQPPSTTS